MVSTSGGHGHLGFFFWVWGNSWSVYQVVTVSLVSFYGLGRQRTVGQYVRWSWSSWFLFLGWEGRGQFVSTSDGHGHLGFFFPVWGDSWSVYQVVTVILVSFSGLGRESTVGQYGSWSWSSWFLFQGMGDSWSVCQAATVFLVSFSGLGRERTVGQYVRWSWLSSFLFLGMGRQLVSISGCQSSWFLFLGWEGRAQLVSTSGGHSHLGFFFWVLGDSWSVYQVVTVILVVSFSGLGRERTVGQYVRRSQSSWFLFLAWEGRAQLVSTSGGNGYLGFYFWVWGDSWSVHQVVTVILIYFSGLGRESTVGQYVRWSWSSWFLFLGMGEQLVSISGGHSQLGFFLWIGKGEDSWSLCEVVMVILVSFSGLGRERTVGQYIRWSWSYWFLFLGMRDSWSVCQAVTVILVSFSGLGRDRKVYQYVRWSWLSLFLFLGMGRQFVSISGGYGHLAFFLWVWKGEDSWSVRQVVMVILVSFSGNGETVGQYIRWSQ